MILTTFVVYVLANGLLHRTSNAEETAKNIKAWCKNQDVMAGMTAIVIFHTDVDITQLKKASLHITKDASIIVKLDNSKQTYSVEDGYKFYDNCNGLHFLFISNVTHTHAGQYKLMHSNISDPQPCNLTVMKDELENTSAVDACGNASAVNAPGNESAVNACGNASAVSFSEGQHNASNIVHVLIAVFLSSGVTFALTVTALYVASKIGCLPFKTGVTTQQIPEDVDTGDSLLTPV